MSDFIKSPAMLEADRELIEESNVDNLLFQVDDDDEIFFIIEAESKAEAQQLAMLADDRIDEEEWDMSIYCRQLTGVRLLRRGTN